MITVPGEVPTTLTQGAMDVEAWQRVCELAVHLGAVPVANTALIGEPEESPIIEDGQHFVGLSDFQDFAGSAESQQKDPRLGTLAYNGYVLLGWRMQRGKITRVKLPETVFDPPIDGDAKRVQEVLDISPKIEVVTLGRVAHELLDYDAQHRNQKGYSASSIIGKSIGMNSVRIWDGIAQRYPGIDNSR